MVTCPVCNKEYKTITKRHLVSKAHLANLKKKNISETEDPAKQLAPAQKSTTKQRSKSSTTTSARVSALERAVADMQATLDRIVSHLRLPSVQDGTGSMHGRTKTFTERDVKGAVSTCLKARQAGERWVAIDDIVGVLKVKSDSELHGLYQVMEAMFYNDAIDLAEGGEPKYPLRIKGHAFGMAALQE